MIIIQTSRGSLTLNRYENGNTTLDFDLCGDDAETDTGAIAAIEAMLDGMELTLLHLFDAGVDFSSEAVMDAIATTIERIFAGYPSTATIYAA